jgi:hypothetical protein
MQHLRISKVVHCERREIDLHILRNRPGTLEKVETLKQGLAMNISKHKFRIYITRPSKKISEMDATEIKLLITHAQSMSSDSKAVKDDKSQEYWENVIRTCKQQKEMKNEELPKDGINGKIAG